jgi:hypothetical protein
MRTELILEDVLQKSRRSRNDQIGVHRVVVIDNFVQSCKTTQFSRNPNRTSEIVRKLCPSTPKVGAVVKWVSIVTAADWELSSGVIENKRGKESVFRGGS